MCKICDIVNIHAYTKLGKFYQSVLKILSRKEILTLIKGHKSITNLRKMMCNNPNLDLVNINAYTIFCEIL